MNRIKKRKRTEKYESDAYRDHPEIYEIPSLHLLQSSVLFFILLFRRLGRLMQGRLLRHRSPTLTYRRRRPETQILKTTRI